MAPLRLQISILQPQNSERLRLRSVRRRRLLPRSALSSGDHAGGSGPCPIVNSSPSVFTPSRGQAEAPELPDQSIHPEGQTENQIPHGPRSPVLAVGLPRCSMTAGCLLSTLPPSVNRRLNSRVQGSRSLPLQLNCVCPIASKAILTWGMARSLFSRRTVVHAQGFPIMDAANDANPSSKLHTRLRLWEFTDRYIFEPIDGLADLYLSVSRSSGSMNLVDELPPRSPYTNPKVRTVYGVVGALKLAVGSYFLVITDRDCVGSYLGHAIFKVTGLKVLPCNDSLNTSAEQKKMESEISELLDAAERTIGLYFSYDINLTLNSQRLYDLGDEFKSRPLWRQAEPRFLWNSYLLEPLIENKLDQYLLPVIQGSFENIHAEVGSEKVDVTLIARRGTGRIGTRMWRRGADPEGYAANFVESEQIVQSKGYTASYVQVRGSMPFLWEQIVDLTYKPSFDVVRQEEAPHVLERHFNDLQKKYGTVLAVDLVNTHGGEGRLHERYAKSIEPILGEDIRYVHFDFHRICGHIHFEHLSQLYDQIEDYLKKHRYFLLDDKGEKIQEQVGTVRTNCIDCLDRTNVTQSMIGRRILESQLQRVGFFGVNDTISKYPNFDASYKVLWANHGDAISIQYSGTPALKGDFVRYGKRSAQGILNDLQYSLARYYLNNFADGTKQDAMDLLQGRYITSVCRDIAAPSKAGFLENYASARLAFALVSGAFMFMMMSLRQARNDGRHLLLSVLWAGLCIGITHFVRTNGRVFTNRPRIYQSRH